jgi:PEP-CTERM motif
LNKYSFALLALSVGLFSATQAKASTLDTFSLTGDGNVFTFSLLSPSTPSSCHGFGDVCYTGVTVLDNGHSQTDTIEFTNDDDINIYNSHGQAVVELSLNNHQPDFFTDNHGVVTFIGGTFHLSGDDNGFGGWDYNGKFDCDNSSNYTLVLDPPTTSPVPEPSSLALMSSGLLAAAGALRSRMKK